MCVNESKSEISFLSLFQATLHSCSFSSTATVSHTISTLQWAYSMLYSTASLAAHSLIQTATRRSRKV